MCRSYGKFASYVRRVLFCHTKRVFNVQRSLVPSKRECYWSCPAAWPPWGWLHSVEWWNPRNTLTFFELVWRLSQYTCISFLKDFPLILGFKIFRIFRVLFENILCIPCLCFYVSPVQIKYRMFCKFRVLVLPYIPYLRIFREFRHSVPSFR